MQPTRLKELGVIQKAIHVTGNGFQGSFPAVALSMAFSLPRKSEENP